MNLPITMHRDAWELSRAERAERMPVTSAVFAEWNAEFPGLRMNATENGLRLAFPRETALQICERHL